MLININFNYENISGEKEIKETITKLKIMIEKLNEYYAKETDSFSRAITNNAIDKLTKLSESLLKNTQVIELYFLAYLLIIHYIFDL